jgi:chromosome segregation ATPase
MPLITHEQALNKLNRLNQISLKSKDKDQTIKDLQAEITKKNDKIAGLYKLFEKSGQLFKKQHNFVDQLKKDLQKESKDKNLSQEQAQHLQEDVKRLDGEKSELENRIKELQAAQTKTKDERDLELQQEKEKTTKLTQQLEQTINIDEQVFELLSPTKCAYSSSSSSATLLQRAQIINNLIDKMMREVVDFQTKSEAELNAAISNLKNIIPGFHSRTANDFAFILEKYCKEKF